MLSDSERERLLVLKRRMEILRDLRTSEQIRQVVEWVISDWHKEINQLIFEETH